MRSQEAGGIAGICVQFALAASATTQGPCNLVWQSATGPNGATFAATARSNELIVGGNFLGTPSVTTRSIARWNGTSWSTVGNGIGLAAPPNAPVPFGFALALTTMPNNDVVVGGGFSGADLTPAANIARWNGSSWFALGPGTNGNVTSLCPLANGELLVGGAFTSPAAGIARWNGSLWSPLGTGIANGSVESVVTMPNGDVVAGGFFSVAGATPASNIARWNGSTWSALGPGLNGSVSTLAVLNDGTLVAGGLFTSSGSTAVHGVARWNGSTWAPLGLGIGVTLPLGSFWVKKLLVLANGDLVVAGMFNLAGGAQARSLARWDGTNWTELGGGTNGQLDDCTRMPNGDLAVVGNFTTAGAVSAVRVATLQPTCRATTAAFGTGCAGAGGLDTLTANGLPWVGATFHATVTGLPVPAVAFAAYGFTQTSVPLGNLVLQGLPGCTALVSPLLTELLVPSANTAQTTVAIPNTPVAIGVNLLAQVVTLETDLSGSVLAVTSSNGLRLTIGAF